MTPLLFLFVAAPPAAPPDAHPGVDDALVRRLVAALKDPDPEVRGNLAVALAKIGTAYVEPLIAALKDPVPERRAGAAYALGLIGPAARAALPALLDALDDKEAEVRRQASYAIARLIPSGGTGPRPAIPEPRISIAPAPAGGKR